MFATLEDIKRVIHNDGLSQRDQLLMLLASKGRGPTKLPELKELGKKVGLKQITRWNLSQVLSSAKGLAINVESGWEITDRGLEIVRQNGLNVSGDLPQKINGELDILISHSSKDTDLVEALIDLLRSALNMPAGMIRCTSISGHKLPAGADVDETLRKEVIASKLLIGVITGLSAQSAYVLFELGARWGANRPILPLLACNAGAEDLRGPLAGFNALNCNSEEDIHQFLSDVAEHLQRDLEKTAVYNKLVKKLGRVSAQTAKTSTFKRGRK